MSKHAIWAMAAALACAVLSYPLAWLRMQRIAVESEGEARQHADGLTSALAYLSKDAARRAMLPFIGQTMARNSRYQVYLAMYCGTGLALAMACSSTIENGTRLAVSPQGLHAVSPLLMFWTVAGLRMAFALPMNLPARWIFRLTGAEREACIAAGRTWTLISALCLLVFLLPVLAVLGMSLRELIVQAVCSAAACVLMVEGLMFADRGIPFAQPRSPGKTNLPLMLTLFVGVLPVFVVGMVRLQLRLEHRTGWLVVLVALAWFVHRSANILRKRSQAQLEDGDEIEGEFQLLGLGVD